MNYTLETISEIEYICNYLIKVSEHDNYYLIGLDMEKIGLNMDYNEICFVMERFFEKIKFCSFLKGIKNIQLEKHFIILEKW